MTIEQVLSKLFRYEAINGGERCPTYLHRWTIFQPRWARWFWRGFGVYLHNFVADDWSRDLHDHPKRFISIGLRGRYREWTPSPSRAELRRRLAGEREPNVFPCGCSRLKVEYGMCRTYSDRTTDYAAPWLRTFPAEHVHRITLIERQPAWTLVIVLASVREWGFWPSGRWVHWREYVKPGNAEADKAKSCP